QSRWRRKRWCRNLASRCSCVGVLTKPVQRTVRVSGGTGLTACGELHAASVVLLRKGVEQPRPGDGPVTLGRRPRNAHARGCFLERQPRKVPEFHEFGFGGFLFAESVESFVERQHVLSRGYHAERFVQFHSQPASTVLWSPLPPRVVDEDAPHRLRRRG